MWRKNGYTSDSLAFDRGKALSPAKLVSVVFLDIRDAFDSVRWHTVLKKFGCLGVDGNQRRLLGSYFSGRTASLRHGSCVAEKTLDRGCPQGSVLRPLCWNLVFDGFVRLAWPDGASLVAFSDDAALVITGENRDRVDELATRSCALVTSWGEANDLVFYPDKMDALIIKGKGFGKSWSKIKMNGRVVLYRESVK